MENNQGNKPAFMKKRDIFILLGILLLAAVIWLVLFLGRQQGAVARVTIGFTEQRVVEIPLTEDGVHFIDDAALPVQLEVAEGRIRFINSVCPDHDCEGFGWLQHDSDWAACLPAGVSVWVEEE